MRYLWTRLLPVLTVLACLYSGSCHAVERPACLPRNGWSTVLGTTSGNARVKVWYERDDDLPAAKALAVALETEIWPALIDRLGMEPPLSDVNLPCSGEGPALDVYLVSFGIFGQYGGTTTNAAPNCHQSPVWIELDRAMAFGKLKAAAAHEFMHAVQWAYKSKECKPKYGWLLDATANWAIDHVYRTDNLEHMHAPWFMETPEKPLDDRHMKDGSEGRDYGAYLFFQFLAKSVGPDVVRAIWQATVDVSSSLEAVDKSVPGGFKEQWPKFAKLLWNQQPINGESFESWDALKERPALAEALPATTSADLNGLAEAKTELGTRLRNLSTSYYHFTFSDEKTRSLLFYNPFFENFKRDEKVTVKAVWHTAENGWAEEDWTQYEFIELCRDLKLQRATELVVIISSAVWSQPGQILVSSAAPYLKRSNIGCYRYEGTATMIEKHGSWNGMGKKTESALVFMTDQRSQGLAVFTPHFPNTLRVVFPSMLLTGLDYTYEQRYSTRCNFSFGPVSYPLSADRPQGFLMINPFPELKTTDPALQDWLSHPRGTYAASAIDIKFVTVNVSGQKSCGPTTTDMVGALIHTNDAKNGAMNNPPITLPTGELKGSFKSSNNNAMWSFHPVSEP
jgi:hypothetical protein